MNVLTVPRAVRPESKIALIAPASRVRPEVTEAFVKAVSDFPDEFPGSGLIVYPSVYDENASGSYSASLQQRLSDFKDAWSRDDVDLVICARGGYGCVHLLDFLDPEFIASRPKWLVGFSDVSALHALLYRAGLMSLHGGMARQLADDTDSGFGGYRAVLKSLVSSSRPRFSYRVASHEHNVCGEAGGVLLGGNLAVLNGLAATPYDLMSVALHKEVVLFIEDVSEPIYAVERMLWRLHLQGVLESVKGIVVGQFTEWRPDRNYDSMYDMISSAFRQWGVRCPVAFNFPVGHNEANVPLVEGINVRLTVTTSDAVLETV